MRIFGLLAVVFFIFAAIMELILQSQTNDWSEKGFHRIGFFGWLILANLEFIYMNVSDKKKG